jgi:hypothetical protein
VAVAFAYLVFARGREEEGRKLVSWWGLLVVIAGCVPRCSAPTDGELCEVRWDLRCEECCTKDH